MSRRFWRLGVLALAMLGGATAPSTAAAQSGPTELTFSRRVPDKQRLIAPPALSEAALNGRILWVQRCALCHDPVTSSGRAPGPWLDKQTVGARGEARVRERIAMGSTTMPGFQYALQPTQVDNLIAFLNTVSPDERPPAAQRTGAQP